MLRIAVWSVMVVVLVQVGLLVVVVGVFFVVVEVVVGVISLQLRGSSS